MLLMLLIVRLKVVTTLLTTGYTLIPYLVATMDQNHVVSSNLLMSSQLRMQLMKRVSLLHTLFDNVMNTGNLV